MMMSIIILYGIDDNEAVPHSVSGVELPQSNIHFSDRDMALLRQTVDPLFLSDNYGIELYEQTLQLILTFVI